MDWYVPSPDGKLIAACLSEHGSEEGILHFYRTENGERLADRKREFTRLLDAAFRH